MQCINNQYKFRIKQATKKKARKLRYGYDTNRIEISFKNRYDLNLSILKSFAKHQLNAWKLTAANRKNFLDEPEDENDLFYLSIAKKTKHLSQQKKIKLQLKVMELVCATLLED